MCVRLRELALGWFPPSVGLSVEDGPSSTIQREVMVGERQESRNMSLALALMTHFYFVILYGSAVPYKVLR